MASQSNDPNSNKVVDLAQARKRQKTVRRAGASSGNLNGGSPGQQKQNSQPKKWVGYVQVFFVLIMVAYMMTLCQGGGSGL